MERNGGSRALRPHAATPSIGLVLGGGGARGLAHILMLEVFDELKLTPKVIAGTSIGAIFGAAYASGLTAREIRAHTVDVLTNRLALVRDLFAVRAKGGQRFWDLISARTALLTPGGLLDVVLPAGVADDFAELEIPLKIVASDFYALEPAVFTSGPLRAAVAASMALPVIFEPVILGGRTYIDGGLTNPLPFDLIEGEADVLIAVDVTGVTVASPKRAQPTVLETLFASSFLFERSIVREKLKRRQPDIYIDAGTGRFQVLDFLKVRDILAAAQPAKEKLKGQLLRVLGAEVLQVAEEIGDGEPVAEVSARPRRQLLKRLTGPMRKPRG